MDRHEHSVYLVIAIIEDVYLIDIWLSLVMFLWHLLTTRLCFQANWPSFRGRRIYAKWQRSSNESTNVRGTKADKTTTGAGSNKQCQKLRMMCRSVDSKFVLRRIFLLSSVKNRAMIIS